MKKIIIYSAISLMLIWTIFLFLSESDRNSEGEKLIDEITEQLNEEDDFINQDLEIGVNIGQLAPDFMTNTLAGQQIKLSDYVGKQVMLNFWATWCPPCQAEVPDMERLYQEHDIEILAVNITSTEASLEDVSQFVNDNELTFKIPIDLDANISDLYFIQSIPTTFMIDSSGKIAHKIIGAMDYNMMLELFRSMD
ncbi:redoxin domain-containing protein [Amphibacillus xylanus]|uniref:Thiol-disulfide oxidoreductase n=1 Tax=Amphibacillus xylanus (strain ATCC 51415 / DSM 6626 / JCM 7361 / LMG 17667 / NBRC 15112 / Ep01) TaxID=698758 RepID=K0IZ55_AMPXN|nr:redoxin domain-containing protein [Amphibacillus xylanus]BAM47835.1 thiol-disulfide oxidoreductase [Amphibacillus xylanus NBRC 15112]